MRIRKWGYTALLIIGLAALMPGFLRSQQGAASEVDAAPYEGELPTARFGVDVNMVSVPVTVRNDNDGSFFKGLKQKSFRILEDGKEQEIVFFAEEGLSTHVAIVLDISGSVRPQWGTVRHATRRFLEQLRPDDYFSLFTFNTETKGMIPWGKKTDRVDAVLSSVYCKDATALWDAIWVVSTQGFAGIDGKKVMIIMSDGLDNDSLSSYEDALRAAVEAGISIYVVSTTKALQQYYEYAYPDVSQWSVQRALVQGEAMLRHLARNTGGRVLQSNDFGQLDDIYAEVYEELRNQYTLGYFSTNTARDGSYREIQVGVLSQDAPNVTVTARTGYYAPRK